jgi:transcriptional regulator with XRE-family HTH domain
MDDPLITPAQCRAGRALLQLSRRQLAERASCSDRVIAYFEQELRKPHENTRRKLGEALYDAGLRFFDDSPEFRDIVARLR